MPQTRGQKIDCVLSSGHYKLTDLVMIQWSVNIILQLGLQLLFLSDS